MVAVKVVVTGPFAAGKTTLIGSVSEVQVVETEQAVTDATASRKPSTTVAMDFGRVTLAPDLVLHLFGTPGQERFGFMWEVLATGMLGYILLVDASREDSLRQAAGVLSSFRSRSDHPYVVALNRADGLDPHEEAHVRSTLDLTPGTPVVPCDARDRASVKHVLLALLHEVLERHDAAVAS